MQSLLNIEVSCFANYSTPSGPKPVNLLAWLKSDKYADTVEAIRQVEDKKERDLLKSKLPCITPHGLFTYRNADKLVRHSGFLQFDIDLGDNLNVGNYPELKQLICQSPNVAYCGLSVSGTGVWGLIPIAHPDKHGQHFDFIKAWFGKSNIKIDDKPRNVASLRGYSYDPDSYFNHNATPLTRFVEDKPANRNAPIGDHRPTGDYDSDCFAWCVSVKDENLFVQGNRNGWLTRLVLMCNDFGVSRGFVESECTRRYAQAGFTEKEVLATIRSVYANHAAKHGTERYNQAGAKVLPLAVQKPAIRPTPSVAIEAFESEKFTQTEPAQTQNETDGWQPLGWGNLQWRELAKPYPMPETQTA